MAIYEVQAPDGSILEIEGPDNATDEQIEAFAASQFQQKAQPAVSSNPVRDAAIGLVSQKVQPLVELASNIPSSAGRFASGIYDTVTSPIESGKTIGKVFKGAVQLLPGSTIRQGEDYRDVARGVGEHYSERYGGAGNLASTIIQDPVGFAADASVALGLGAAGLKMAGFQKTASALSTASKTVDPLQAAGRAASTIAKPVVSQVLGRTTGSGSQAISKAIEGKPEFVQAMRGEVDDLGVVEKAREAFSNMKEARALEYQSQLSNLKNSTKQIDIAPIKSGADDWLKRFNVKKSPTGELDFSRSTISGQAVKDVTDIYTDIQNWGSKADDLTPVMVDTLKRRISDFYTDNNKARAMIADLSNKTSKAIEKSVPEYKQMTSGYENASKMIRSTEQALLSKNPDHIDTALRRIMMGVREEKGLRRNLMDDLSKFSDEDIQALAAGRVSSQWFTRRLESTLTGGAGIGLGFAVTPYMFALAASASPRVASEVTLFLSRVAKAVSKTPRAAYLVPQQIGSMQESLNIPEQ